MGGGGVQGEIAALTVLYDFRDSEWVKRRPGEMEV